MKRINIRESLLNMDRETDCKYDLTSLYESVKLDDEKKKQVCQYIDKYDIEATNRFLSNEAASQGLMENCSDDIADEELNEWFDDDWNGDEESTYEYIASKSVPDSDGFYTDYTWYRNVDTDQHVFVFGDTDIYKPEHGDSDHECDSYEEAQEWFDSYNGFDEIDESLNESPDLIPIEIVPDNRPKKNYIGDKEVSYKDYDDAKARWREDFNIADYRDELDQFIKSHKGYEHAFDVDVVKDNGEEKLYIDIPWGDWKHQHWAADHLVQDFFMQKGLLVKPESRTYEKDGSDNYSAEHYYSLSDFVFSEVPVEEESLDEDFKPGDQVFCKANKKVGTVKSVKGDNVEVEFTGGEDPDRIDTYYKQDLQLNEDVANFDEIQQQAMEDDADQEEMRDYIENVYIDVLDELEEEYPGLFLESNVQGDMGTIDVWFNKDDVEYYATWDYNDELIDLSEMFFDATSAEDFKEELKNFIRGKLATAKPTDDDIDESIEQPTEEEVVESLTPAKQTLDEGWFSDDDFEDDMEHANTYGGDTMYCPTCGTKKTYDEDGYAYCPQCNSQSLDESKNVGIAFDAEAPEEYSESEIEDTVTKALDKTPVNVSGYMEVHSLDEDLEDDLEARYTVRNAHANKSVLANINKVMSSDLVASVEPITMYDNQLFKMTATDGRVFFLVPCTLSQFDVYDEQENLIRKSEFASYIANEILSTGDMQFTYKVVGGEFAGDYTREELEELPCFGGLYTEDKSRPKLDNQPILDGYLSPMVDGWKDNKIVIRYETEQMYNMLSEDGKDLSSKKGTLGNLIASNNDTIKTFTTKEEIINFLIDIEPQCTNKKYLNKVKMDIIHSKNFTRAMQYLYDAMLKGDGLGSIEKEIRGTKKFAYESLEEDYWDPLAVQYTHELQNVNIDIADKESAVNELINNWGFTPEEAEGLYNRILDYNNESMQESTKSIKCPVNGLYDGKEDNCFYFKDGQCTLTRDGGNPGEECKEYRDWERDHERKLRMHLLSTNQFEESLTESSDENWAVFATDVESGKEYCAGVYESEDYAGYWAAQDRAADVEFDYGDFKYRVEQVPEYTNDMVQSQRELNSLKISNHEASQEELRRAFDEE